MLLAVADQYAACSILGNLDFCGKGVGSIEYPHGNVFRHHLRTRVVDISLSGPAELGGAGRRGERRRRTAVRVNLYYCDIFNKEMKA